MLGCAPQGVALIGFLCRSTQPKCYRQDDEKKVVFGFFPLCFTDRPINNPTHNLS